MSFYNDRSAWRQATRPTLANLQSVFHLLTMLFSPGEVTELRLAETRSDQARTRIRYSGNGYFNDPAALVEAALPYNGTVSAISFTINPVRRALLDAADNELRRPC